MNYLIAIEYDGSNYHGWQIQRRLSGEEKTTVSGKLIEAIYKITGIQPVLYASGRTDAGVHALNQVANFHIPYAYDLFRFKIAINGVLPPDISVKHIEFVHDSFHATNDVISKVYLYRINSGFKSSILRNYSWYVKDALNFELIKEASQYFIGCHNFINFAKKEKNRSADLYWRTITDIKIIKKGFGFDIMIEGRGFLRHMIRRIVGAIISYGAGKTGGHSLVNLLNGDKRAFPASAAPARGLFLYSVEYKHKIFVDS